MAYAFRRPFSPMRLFDQHAIGSAEESFLGSVAWAKFYSNCLQPATCNLQKYDAAALGGKEICKCKGTERDSILYTNFINCLAAHRSIFDTHHNARATAISSRKPTLQRSRKPKPKPKPKPFSLRSRDGPGSSRNPHRLGHSEEPDRALLDMGNATTADQAETDRSEQKQDQKQKQTSHLDTSTGHVDREMKSAGFKCSKKGRFHYNPLPSNDLRVLRLLNLLPAPTLDEPLICTLDFAASLPQDNHEGEEKDDDDTTEFVHVNYEALSYTWGSTSSTGTITLNGCPFEVTKNLEAALRHLREQDALRTLWVDAICIDQENVEERCREVARMSSIYYHARRVVVWLGEGSPDSDAAMNFATQIYEKFAEHPVFGHIDEVAMNCAAALWAPPGDSDAAMNFRTGINQLIAEFNPTGSTDMDSEEEEEDENRFDWMEPTTRMGVVHNLVKKKHISSWLSLQRFFSRPWWGRAWIFQEVAVAKRIVVYCGCISKPWIVINLAAQVASDTYHSIHILVNGWWRVFRKPYTWPGSNCDLILQLVHSREERVQQDYRNTLTRSHVPISLSINSVHMVALDYLWQISGAREITVDYSLPAMTVFKSTVKAYVNTFGWLNIICHSHYAPWYPPDHPSWVPEWTRPPRTSVFIERPLNFHHTVDRIPMRVSFSSDLSELTVEGVVLGSITKTALEFDLIPGLMKWRARAPSSSQQAAAAAATTTTETQIDIGEQAVKAPEPLAWEFKKAFQTIIAPVFMAHSHFGLTSNRLALFLEALTISYLPPSASKNHPKYRAKPDRVPLSRRAELDDFYTNVRGHLVGRTIFSTTSCPTTLPWSSSNPRLVGIAHEFVQTGDILCLIKGCDALVVLRELKGGNWKGREVYMFLGEAYVPGVNRSEAIGEQLSWKDIVLV
ncbi:hypothetical protein G7Y89_g7369 [Cudoniella acicularis]|uniref:Heterokaryon incompatibility domain-containing protein n=1 Tax=Cudoniella acicularis TaxID=354080 RepID=A0A8H4RJH3_9HELO|nr:hypothetical protein G7Y89_g7369 [Cudoniella acicularis]